MLKRNITLSRVGCYFGLLIILFGAAYGYFWQDDRSDQRKELNSTLNLCSEPELAEKLRTGLINKDDFRDVLFLRIEDDRPDDVRKLLELGARTDMRNAEGLTAWKYAAKLQRATGFLTMFQHDYPVPSSSK